MAVNLGVVIIKKYSKKGKSVEPLINRIDVAMELAFLVHLLFHYPLLLFDLLHESLVVGLFGWVHFLIFLVLNGLLLSQMILSIRIYLFDLGLDSQVLLLPYLPFFLPHVSLLIEISFWILFIFDFVLMLIVKGIDHCYFFFLDSLLLQLLFLSEFLLLNLLIPSDHFIFFLLLLVHAS